MNFLRKLRKESTDKRSTFINNSLLSRKSDQKEKEAYSNNSSNHSNYISNLNKEKTKINHASSNNRLELKESVDSFLGQDSEEEEEKGTKSTYDKNNRSINNNIKSNDSKITNHVDRTFSRQNESNIKPVQSNLIKQASSMNSRNTITNDKTKQLSVQPTQKSPIGNQQKSNISNPFSLDKIESSKRISESSNTCNRNMSTVSRTLETPKEVLQESSSKIASSSSRIIETNQKKEQTEKGSTDLLKRNMIASIKKEEVKHESSEAYEKAYTKDLLSAFSLHQTSNRKIIEKKVTDIPYEEKAHEREEKRVNSQIIDSKNSMLKENKNEEGRVISSNSRNHIELARRNTHVSPERNDNRTSVVKDHSILKKENNNKEFEKVKEEKHIETERLQILEKQKKSLLSQQKMCQEYSKERKSSRISLHDELLHSSKERNDFSNEMTQSVTQQTMQKKPSIPLHQISNYLKNEKGSRTSISKRLSNVQESMPVMQKMKTQQKKLNHSLKNSYNIQDSNHQNEEELVLKESKDTLQLSNNKTNENMKFEIEHSRKTIQSKNSRSGISSVIDSNYDMKDLINNQMNESSLLESTNSLLQSSDITKETIHIEIDPISIEVNTRTSSNQINDSSLSNDSRINYLISNDYHKMSSRNAHNTISEESMKESKEEKQKESRGRNYKSSLLSHFTNNFEKTSKQDPAMTESMDTYQTPRYDYKHYKTYIYNQNRNNEITLEFEKHRNFTEKREHVSRIIYSNHYENSFSKNQGNHISSKHYEESTKNNKESIDDSVTTSNSCIESNQKKSFEEPLDHEYLNMYEREPSKEHTTDINNAASIPINHTSHFSNTFSYSKNNDHSLNLSEISVSRNSEMSQSNLEEMSISKLSNSHMNGSVSSSMRLGLTDFEIDDKLNQCEISTITSKSQPTNAHHPNFPTEEMLHSRIKDINLRISYIENQIHEKIKKLDEEFGELFEHKCNKVLEKIERILGRKLL